MIHEYAKVADWHGWAAFSPCRGYRYALGRVWEPGGPLVMFLMLNPSTADAAAQDATVERCQRRARAWGAGGLLVGNIFAWRSTDPGALYTQPDPAGPENDSSILTLASLAATVVCGWGTHGELGNRGRRVLSMLQGAGVTPQALRITKGGQPGHPLYIGYSVQPQPLQEPANV